MLDDALFDFFQAIVVFVQHRLGVEEIKIVGGSFFPWQVQHQVDIGGLLTVVRTLGVHTFQFQDFLVESLLGEMASLIGGVEDLVVEDGEVQGETQTDGVSGRQLVLGNIGGSLVSLEGLVGRVLALVASSKLGEVTVVVTLPVGIVSTRNSGENYGSA